MIIIHLIRPRLPPSVAHHDDAGGGDGDSGNDNDDDDILRMIKMIIR